MRTYLDIPTKGTMKFVLLRNPENEDLYVVARTLEFHADIAESFCQETELPLDCLGGGRMKIDEHEIHCFGYSIGYGRPDSDTVERIIREHSDKRILMEIGKGY